MLLMIAPCFFNCLTHFGFKGLDLIDRVPEELWMEDCNAVQETGIETIPKKKKCKKAKWVFEEALQIAEKRREAKGKEEKKNIPN